MGSSNQDYSKEIQTGLQQANMPKSPLAQTLSSTLNNNAQSILQNLMGGGGNAYPGAVGGSSTPGSALNGGGTQNYAGGQLNNTTQQLAGPTVGVTQLPKNNTDDYNTLLQFLGRTNPTTYQNPDGTQFKAGGGDLGSDVAGRSLVGGLVPSAPNQNTQGLGANPGNQVTQNQNQQGYPQAAQANPNLVSSTSQSNPQQGALNLGGIDPSMLQRLMQQYQNPSQQFTSSQNQSQDLMNKLQGQTPGVNNLDTYLQSALGNSLNGSGAQLPNMNLGNANLQAAMPQNINPQNVGLSLDNVKDVNSPAANLSTGLPNPQDSAYYQSVQQVLNQQNDKNVKDLQARFGAAGGASRGTPAAYAQAEYSAQALPQMAQALGQVRQQEVGNQLTAQNQGNNANLTARGQDLTNSQQNVGNQLQNQNNINNALLTQQQQGLNNSQQNVQNYLQSIGLNNNSNLQARGQNLDALGLQQQGALQNQGLVNQANSNNLNSISSLFNNVGGLQNQNNSILAQLAGQAGNLGLNYNQLGSQNQLATNQQNSSNVNNALSQLLGFQNSNNQSQLGQNQLNASNSQFNSGQQNSMIQSLNQLLSGNSQFNAGQQNQNNQFNSSQQQTANQNQINNQFTGNQNLAQILAQFGLSGIPGGSANISLGGNAGSSGSGLGDIGSLLAGIGSMAAAF